MILQSTLCTSDANSFSVHTRNLGIKATSFNISVRNLGQFRPCAVRFEGKLDAVPSEIFGPPTAEAKNCRRVPEGEFVLKLIRSKGKDWNNPPLPKVLRDSVTSWNI
ncbi:hypothetical protein C3K47_15710 [Solitalea longa]|uniref:Uncharacterized protein n=1 Tax=Solitalea longa TaxID=2079460 RepID=A0A2S4ZYS6_9SPHI|nr:hypothetical protein [Solitalea longa]POY35504.1 hypothetical protein C3K47_15710 [Solitalea longa]